MKKIVCLFSLLIGAAAPAFADVALPQSAAQPEASIVAVVNDDLISARDLNNRIALVLATTQLSNTPETRARIAPQLLRGLIDEKLQLQEAAKVGITITDADVNAAIAQIEQQRDIPAGTLLPGLASHGVPKDALTAQVRAQLAWNKLIMKKIRPGLRVSDDEIDRERGKPQVSAGGDSGGSEVQIETLPLPVDKPEHEAQMKALAQKLSAEIRGGASFESVARAMGGAAAGDIQPFWVPASQLDPAIIAVLKAAIPGSVTPPVRTSQGYVIVRFMARRGAAATPTPSNTITEVVVKDIALKLAPSAGPKEVEATLAVGREIAQHPGDCHEAGVAGMEDAKNYGIEVKFRREALDSFPETLRGIVEKLNVGEVSEPYASREGIRLFMLCERVETPAPMADRDETAQRLYRQKIELEAEKYLRRLRREATIDVRMNGPEGS